MYIHPEQRDGEAFMGNFTDDQYQRNIFWKTKRKGNIPYTRSGDVHPSYKDGIVFPVFMKRSECEHAANFWDERYKHFVQPDMSIPLEQKDFYEKEWAEDFKRLEELERDIVSFLAYEINREYLLKKYPELFNQHTKGENQ